MRRVISPFYWLITVLIIGCQVSNPTVPQNTEAKSTLHVTETDKKLFVAVNSLDIEEVQLALKEGAKINAKGHEEVTPLHVAVQRNSVEISRMLLDHGAFVDSTTVTGYTPLVYAAVQGNTDIAELLIVKGSNVNHKDINSISPLIWSLNIAVKASDPDKFNVPPESRGVLGNLAGEWKDVAILLVNHGADVNSVTEGNAALDLAVTLGDKELVDILIDHGADLDYAGSLETALHNAIAEQHREIAEDLIVRGANVNSLNMTNRTPLHFLAVFMRDARLAELMLDHGANVNAKDKNGHTPLDFAINANNYQVEKVLRKYKAK
ncbi:MAG: hypothetical protein GY792_00880 [Gammaproteobacteria bacterium]|nr:hypothetical protein [Gammaproteobacteria bacterium]